MRRTGRPATAGASARAPIVSGACRVRSVVVPSAPDGAPRPPEQHQDQADNEDDDAERPQDGDLEQEPGDEQGEADDDQEVLLTVDRADWLHCSQKVECEAAPRWDVSV